MSSGFISDGYTETAYFKAREKMYEALVFEFRPMTLTEQAEWQKEYDRIQKKEPDNPLAVRENVATWLARKLVNWDLTGPAGKVEITRANVLKLKDDLFFRLWRVVSLQEVWDDLPEGAKPVDLVESQKN